MRTKIEVAIEIVEQAVAAVQRLAGANHSPKEIGEYVQSVGATVELFLKDVVFPEQSSDTFYNLINSLSVLGMSSTGSDGLHNLRLKYNAFKHNPNVGVSAIEALKSMDNALAALRELTTVGPDSIHNPSNKRYSRVLWIAGWDHFTSGDTEVHVMVPYAKGDFSTVLDYYNIKWEGWQQVVDGFVTDGSLEMGQTLFPPDVYARLQGGDFIEAGIFTGDYRELVLELSKWVDYKRDEELLPMLRRKNDICSIFTAVLFAAMEVLAKGRYKDNVPEFVREMIDEAEFQYGVDRSSGYIVPFTTGVASLIVDLSDVARTELVGPLWVTSEKFDQLKTTALAISTDFKILVTQDCELIAVV